MTSLVDIIRKECIYNTPYQTFYRDSGSRSIFKYREELAGSYVRGPNNAVFYFLPSERKNSAEFSKQFKGERPRPKTRPVLSEVQTYKSPVYKYHEVGVFDESHYQGPQTINSEPLIEAITYKNRTIYFGMINQKIAIYSTYHDENGKKQMYLYQVNTISDENENRLYLKQQALSFLTELRNKDKADYESFVVSQQVFSEERSAA